MGARPADTTVDAVARSDQRVRTPRHPRDITANRLDPWHGGWLLGVPVVAEFTCPNPRLPRAAGSHKPAALGVSVAQRVRPSVVSRDHRRGHCRAHLRRLIACPHLSRFGAV
ncbi:DUF5914 domain-containing protein [Nocardia beijingensis]|uniref:DUF5914 domain-containing protein n=1 Tax=Nocardia beijingensis TaxID=95162 RepID=UPI003F4CBEC2